MSLLGRLAWILIKRARVGRIHPLDKLRVRSRVMPQDLDLNLHVNNGRYLTFADLGRMDWFIRTGCFQAARKEKCIPVIGDATARFIRQLRAFDRFYVETQLLGWNEKVGLSGTSYTRPTGPLGSDCCSERYVFGINKQVE